MGSRRMVLLKFENLESVDHYRQTITVNIEGHQYTFNGKVSDIMNSVVFVDGEQTPISKLKSLPRNRSVPGLIKIDENIVVNSGLYHLVKG